LLPTVTLLMRALHARIVLECSQQNHTLGGRDTFRNDGESANASCYQWSSGQLAQRGVSQSGVFNDLDRPNLKEYGYALVNLCAADARPDRRTEVSLIGRNVCDRIYISDAGNTGHAFGIPTFIADAPPIPRTRALYLPCGMSRITTSARRAP
jgi:hypothetical protein